MFAVHDNTGEHIYMLLRNNQHGCILAYDIKLEDYPQLLKPEFLPLFLRFSSDALS